MATYAEALVLDKDGSTIVFSCCAKVRLRLFSQSA